MTDTFITYLLVFCVACLVIVAFIIGAEKMVKIIFGNYILSTLCLAAHQSLDILTNFLTNSPEQVFAGFSFAQYAQFVQGSGTGIILFIYLALLLLLYRKSTIRVSLPQDEILNKALLIFLVPLSVMSMILSLQIVLLGIQVVNIQALQTFAQSITANPYLFGFITLTPVWIFIHGVATVFISCELKITFKGDM